MKNQPKKLGLRLTLSDLLMKLGRYEEAITVCNDCNDMLGSADSLESLMSRTRVLQLKAKVFKREGNGDSYAKVCVCVRARERERERERARARARERERAREIPPGVSLTSGKLACCVHCDQS